MTCCLYQTWQVSFDPRTGSRLEQAALPFARLPP